MTTISNQPDYIPLAMINALAYCPRRFGYEFIQAEMLLNEHVVEGTLRHQGVDLGGKAWPGEAVQQRRVYVWSERLRLAGLCDLVEERDGLLYPVEYKKGRPGRWKSDHAQLDQQKQQLAMLEKKIELENLALKAENKQLKDRLDHIEQALARAQPNPELGKKAHRKLASQR